MPRDFPVLVQEPTNDLRDLNRAWVRAMYPPTVPSNDLHLLDIRLDSRRRETANDMQPDAFFGLFVSELVLKRYQPGIPAVLAGIVDGEGDCGIDAFYCFVNDQLLAPGVEVSRMGREPRIELHLIQAKRATKFGEEALQKLQIHLPELLDLDRNESALQSRVNPRLLDATRLFLKACRDLAHFNPRFRIEIHYATRADTVHPNTRERARSLEDSLARLFGDCKVSVGFYGPAELLSLDRQQNRVSKELSIADGPLASDSERGQGYVCLVDLRDLYALICEPESDRLHTAIFEANVRDHLNSSRVNKAIHETLEDVSSPDFWWLNNGVTIVSPNARQLGKKLYLEDPQIVNGLQTSHEIFQYFNQGGSSLQRRLVLVRVICATDDSVRDAIIRATNNQNKLPPSALRATDRLQQNIEEYFAARGFYYDRRKNYHLNRGHRVDKIVSVEFLSQCMTAGLLREPWRARRDAALLLGEDVYPRIFSDDIPLATYFSCLLLARRIKHLLEVSPPFASSSRFVDDYLFHATTVAVMLLCRRISPSASEISNIDTQRLDQDAVMELVKIVGAEFERYLGRVRIKPESSAAEDQDTSERVLARVRRMLNSQRFVGWPEWHLDDEFRTLGRDVVYSSESRPRKV
jgi:hypothetical protein